MPCNRSLEVEVTFIGTQASDGSYGGTASYKQTGCTPPMNLVAPDGGINLEGLEADPEYHWAIGITFTLNATVTNLHGQNVPCTWATPLSKACAITGPDRGPATGMPVTQPQPDQIHIHNPNADRSKSPRAERTYEYKLGVMLPSVHDYFISLDPKIVNTGPRTIAP